MVKGSVLCYVSSVSELRHVLPLAVSFADKYDYARLEVLRINSPSIDIVPMYGEISTVSLMQDTLDQNIEQENKKTDKIEAAFDKLSSELSCKVKLSFKVLDGIEDEVLCLRAKVADLVIFPYALDENTKVLWLMQNLLEESGKPVIAVSENVKSIDFAKPMLLWNDNFQAGKALSLASRIIEKNKLNIADIQEENLHISGVEELEEYLLTHNKHKPTIHKPQNTEELLAVIKKKKIDGVIMGAYASSSLKRLILGGVTKEMLLKAGQNVPLFMAN